MNEYILIISTSIDLATDRVVDFLTKKNFPVIRLNTEDLPYKKAIFNKIEPEQQTVFNLSTDIVTSPIKSIWYRRIRTPNCPNDCDIGVHRYVINETYAALRGILNIFKDNYRWMSFPGNVESSELKPYQLHIAKKIGFNIPPTLISSDPRTIREFYKEHKGNVIAKPIRSGYLEIEGEGFAIYTRRLEQKDVESIDFALPCPIIVQKEIQKVFDIRLTVVGEIIFSVSIDSQINPISQVDWRKTESLNLPHYVHKLPKSIKILVLKLMRSLGLSFGAIDLVLDNKGNYIFLEINASGQWLWIEDKLRLPISEAIADWLGDI